MINLHDKLWVIVAPHRENNVAYMTYYEDNKAFEKRKSTGESWAQNRKWNSKEQRYEQVETGEPNIYDNELLSGFCIADVASRWSTQNKLFRVKDPRGFTVEVPSGNIPILLENTTVVNGVIQERCKWGREGNNHILLSEGSQPYLDSIENNKAMDERVAISKLKVGQMFKEHPESNKSVQYLGKVKVSWTFQVYKAIERKNNTSTWRGGSWHYTRKPETDPKLESETIKDNRWMHLYKSGKSDFYLAVSSKKVVALDEVKKVVKPKKPDLWIPERVGKRLSKQSVISAHSSSYYSDDPNYTEINVTAVEWSE